MSKAEYKRYDRFNLAIDVIFFLPRQIMRVIKWLF
ncbi:hypothetical protein JOD25_003293 [Kurthia huakuii]|nr:hypothetical protein [Kurthia huakuii]